MMALIRSQSCTTSAGPSFSHLVSAHNNLDTACVRYRYTAILASQTACTDGEESVNADDTAEDDEGGSENMEERILNAELIGRAW